MPHFALELKANLVNVTNLRPADYATHHWCMKFKCSSCGAKFDHWQSATAEEIHVLHEHQRIANLIENCPFCAIQYSIHILPDSYKPYDANKNEQWQQIVRFDCRGMEPVDFDPTVGWVAEGSESGTVFEDIDLTDKEWADYDEKLNQPVEINSIDVRFVSVKYRKKDQKYYLAFQSCK
uniref:C2H2-type domain-containing protein n=1 Tax=Panagrellus redivivus TaxID=6233 RepID=A0A7E4ULD8_PANRE